MTVPNNYINYTAKAKVDGQVVRFGGDTIFDGSDLSELQVGIPTLLPANIDSQEQTENQSESSDGTD